jgi:hypothetical protein
MHARALARVDTDFVWISSILGSVVCAKAGKQTFPTNFIHFVRSLEWLQEYVVA